MSSSLRTSASRTGEGQDRFLDVPRVLHGGEGAWRKGRFPVTGSRTWSRGRAGNVWGLNVVKPYDTGSWWMSSLRWPLVVLAPFSRDVCLSLPPYPRFFSSPWRFFHSEIVIQLYPTRSKLFIFLGVSRTKAPDLLFILWIFWQHFLPASVSQRFSALFSPILPDAFLHQNLGSLNESCSQSSDQALQPFPLFNLLCWVVLLLSHWLSYLFPGKY